MRFSSYQIHHIIQVYIDKLSSGEGKTELFSKGNLPSDNGNPVSKADSQIIAERITKDISDRINDICKNGIVPKQFARSNLPEAVSAGELKKETIPAACIGELQISGSEPGPVINKDKSVREDKNYVYNTIDESGKMITREISLKDSGFLMKNLRRV